MDTGDVVASTIATLSLIATAILAYRQTRLQAKLAVIEQTRQGGVPLMVEKRADAGSRWPILCGGDDSLGNHLLDR
jgi:hypothetical protein